MIDDLKKKGQRFDELEREKEKAIQEKIKAERQVVSHLGRHEDEVRTRIDLEIKINKLYNTNLTLKNHTATLESKVSEDEATITTLKELARK